MSESGSTITFPCKVIARSVVRTLGRLLLPVACRIRITGRENFPKRGPLLVVGNHTAAMEAVLMLDIFHTTALAKLLHRPVVLKIFSRNLRLPTSALQDLENEHDAGVIADATRSILDYLRDENPYLLTYRFGPPEAEAMQAGLEELLALARWTAESGLALTITPVRRFYSLDQEREVVQIKQGSFERWM
jgi:hypothetical protein